MSATVRAVKANPPKLVTSAYIVLILTVAANAWIFDSTHQEPSFAVSWVILCTAPSGVLMMALSAFAGFHGIALPMYPLLAFAGVLQALFFYRRGARRRPVVSLT